MGMLDDKITSNEINYGSDNEQEPEEPIVDEEPILLDYVTYDTLQDKLDALFRGEELLLRGYEQTSGKDVLVRLFDNGKYQLTQISIDYTDNELDKRYWVSYSVGLNELSLLTTLKFDPELFQYKHKYHLGDIVKYTSKQSQVYDSAIIDAVYVKRGVQNEYYYLLSREDETELYREEELEKAEL